MRYALIKDGVVTNVIELNRSNKDDFPNAVCVDGLPVGVGDVYRDNGFYREEEEVKPVQYEGWETARIYGEALNTLGVETEEEVTNDAE